MTVFISGMSESLQMDAFIARLDRYISLKLHYFNLFPSVYKSTNICLLLNYVSHYILLVRTFNTYNNPLLQLET
jgi:hypothetical protein